MTRSEASPRYGTLAKVLVSAAFAFGALAWAGRASASTSFPAEVDKALGLPTGWVETMVAPPDGCLLCHQSELGGLNTNNAFGHELLQNGAMPAEPGTVDGALMATETSDPLAIQDIKTGVNPNNDPTWLTRSTSSDPTPRYGCAVTAARTEVGPSRLALFASLGLLVAAGARRTRRR